MIYAGPSRFARPPAGRIALAGSLAAVLLVLGLLLLPRPALAAPVPSQGSPSLVFSEFYAPQDSDEHTQWFEIHNIQPTFSYPLDGLVIATSGRRVTLHTPLVISGTQAGGTGSYVLFVFSTDAVPRGYVPAVPGAHVIAVPDLGKLNPAADALILYTPDGSLVINQVNWGTPDSTWLNYNNDLWNPGLLPIDPTKCPTCTWGRTPGDHNTNLPRPPDGDWTQHAIPTPGGAVGPPPQPAFLGGYTDWAGAISSLLLWAAFIIIAVIAYRFERLRDTRTYWQLLLLAPSGLLFYTAVVIIGFGQRGGSLTNDQKWLSFPVLAISALFCLIALGVFRNVSRTLLEVEGD
jgi:hypothetical protein